jgi:hypothetical protein
VIGDQQVQQMLSHSRRQLKLESVTVCVGLVQNFIRPTSFGSHVSVLAFFINAPSGHSNCSILIQYSSPNRRDNVKSLAHECAIAVKLPSRIQSTAQFDRRRLRPLYLTLTLV